MPALRPGSGQDFVIIDKLKAAKYSVIVWSPPRLNFPAALERLDRFAERRLA